MARTKIKDLPPHKAIGLVMFSVLEPYYKDGKKRVREEITNKRASEAAERSSSDTWAGICSTARSRVHPAARSSV